jgi:anti-sigma B factor antagonist
MIITKFEDNEKITFNLVGRLDTTTAPKLQPELIESFSKFDVVRVDLKELTYLSSAGIRVIVSAEKIARSSDKKLILSNVNKDIFEILEMTGFTELLNFE